MSTVITNGVGSGGFAAEVKADNRLQVTAVTESRQHATAHDAELSFQIIGTATLAAGTVTALHLANTNVDRSIAITFVRHQVIGAAGGTAFPNASNYFRIASGRTRVSGGVVVAPINTVSGAAKTSGITAYDNAPALAGTAKELDRWYTKSDADMNALNKDGSLLIAPGGVLELSYVGDRTSGLLYTRVSCYVTEKRS